MKRAILLAVILMGCTSQAEIQACGDMCQLGVKSFSKANGNASCVCNQIEDICKAIQVQRADPEPVEQP